MINILEKGYKSIPEEDVFYKKCVTCGCKFTYQREDLVFSWDMESLVVCPDCKYSNSIIFKRKYKEKKHGRKRD